MAYAPDLVRKALQNLFETRDGAASVCPSEVARALAKNRDGTDTCWREAMGDVHAAVDILVKGEDLTLSWKGKVLAERSGPYRIRRL